MAEVHDRPRVPDPRLEMKDPSSLDTGVPAHQDDFRFRAAPRWPVTVGRVPTRASAFRTRESVQERVRAARTTASTVVLAPGQQTGGDGFGCSQLAGSFADEATTDGTELVVWVDAGAPGAVVEAFARAAAEVQAPGATGRASDTEADACAFLDWVAVTDRSWLVVLDGIVDPARMNGWWPAATGGTGWVLATARQRHTTLGADGRAVVDVDGFTADEAESYLIDRLTADGRGDLLDDAVPGLAETLERLPAALSQAAAYMLAQGTSSAAYRDLYLQSVQRLRDLRPIADRHERVVAATSLLALDAADACEPAGLARPAMALASVLDPAGHPMAFWATDAVARHLGEHRTSGAAPKSPGPVGRGVLWSRIRSGRPAPGPSSGAGRVDELQARAVLDLLVRYGLVQVHDPAAGRAVRVDALTARAVCDTAATGSVPSVAVVAADALMTLWPDQHHDRPELVAALRANADSIAARAGGMLWADDHQHPLVEQVGLDLLHRGLHSAAAGYWQQVGAAAGRHLGSRHVCALAAEANLAVAYWQAGRTEDAIAIEEKLAADRLRILGPDHPDTLTVQANLAASYRQAGRTDEATAILEKVAAEAVKVLGPEHPSTLTTHASLAVSYWQAGRIDEAIAILERVAAERESILGPDDPSTLTVQANLAASFWRAGRAEEAIAIEEKETADRARLFGPRHPTTLTAQAGLAASYHRAGRTKDAVGLLERVLAGRERLLGPDHPDTVAIADTLRTWKER
jgi:tetratricopeptide (TPR) repeat protein